MHRPEFPEAERLAIAAGALLDEEHRTARIELHRKADRDEKRRTQHQSDRRADDADRARGEVGPAVVSEALPEDQHARPQRFDGHLAHQSLGELERVLDEDAAHPRFEQRLQRQPFAAVGDRDDDECRMHLLDNLPEASRRTKPPRCAPVNPGRA